MSVLYQCTQIIVRSCLYTLIQDGHSFCKHLHIILFSELFQFNHPDDVAFNAALLEISHGPLNYDIDRLKTLIFNPLHDMNLITDNGLIADYDPEIKISTQNNNLIANT